MFDQTAGNRLAAQLGEIALSGFRLQMSLMAIGPDIAMRCLMPNGARREPARFTPLAPAVWPSYRTREPMSAFTDASLALWRGFFQHAEAMRGASAPPAMWPAFASGAGGPGHAAQMMSEVPRMHVAYQPGFRSPLWPWAAPGMLMLGVSVPPALEAAMTGWTELSRRMMGFA